MSFFKNLLFWFWFVFSFDYIAKQGRDSSRAASACASAGQKGMQVKQANELLQGLLGERAGRLKTQTGGMWEGGKGGSCRSDRLVLFECKHM